MSRTIAKTAKVLVAVAAAATMPILAAGTAEAHTSSGCTVEPMTPIFAGFNTAGTKLINYRVSVTCTGGRSVEITQERWESDGWPNPDDHLGTSTFNRTFSVTGSTTISNVRTLVDGELGNEEVYQKVRFRVTSNGVTSPWTGWHSSAQLSIAN